EYRECRYTVCKPCYENVVREVRYTVCKPVKETVMHEECVTVCCPVKETCYKECRYTVCVPVKTQRIEERHYTACRPVESIENHEECYTVCVPRKIYRTVTREVSNCSTVREYLPPKRYSQPAGSCDTCANGGGSAVVAGGRGIFGRKIHRSCACDPCSGKLA